MTVDTTVQEKAVAFPTDSKLLEDARRQLVRLAEEHGLKLRQNYSRVAKHLRRKISGYSHARQYRRMRRELKKLRTRVGRVIRDVERQLAPRPAFVQDAFATPLAQAHQILNQKPKDKGKLYSVHAPEVECISKGKAHKRYEFGVKASFATTHKNGFVLGARTFPGNPYDGHTLSEQLEQAHVLSGVKPQRC